MRMRRRLRPVVDRLDDRCLPSGLTPAQVTQAYGLGGLTFTAPSGAPVAADGGGTTIALIEAYHDPTLTQDLQTFDQAYNLPAPSLNVVDLAGSTSDPTWALEESLDVEWAHAIAPGANIVVIEAPSQSMAAIRMAINTARNIPTVDVVSMSLGFPESTYHGSLNLTTPPGHAGITFVAASGDNGLASGSSWPAVSPNVLAVGGTTLYLDAAGNYAGEVSWSGSGGGLSKYVAEPRYQRSISSAGRRMTPDVSFLGDPNTGVAVYQTDPYSGLGSWQIVGGTSLGTPAWAAIVAIADEGRILQGKGTLDGPSQTLPALYSLPSSDFHQVVSYRAGKPAMMGLGSPVGGPLIAGLVASNIDVPLTVSSARTPAFRAQRVRVRRAFREAPRHRHVARAHPFATARHAIHAAPTVHTDLGSARHPADRSENPGRPIADLLDSLPWNHQSATNRGSQALRDV